MLPIFDLEILQIHLVNKAEMLLLHTLHISPGHP